MQSRTEYIDEEFCDALATYRNQDIHESINSENSLVRMFAVLDRRIGKRTLQRLRDEAEQQQEWLRYIYQIRIDGEGI